MKKKMTARLYAAVMAVSVFMTGMTAFAADETYTQVTPDAAAAADMQVTPAAAANVIAVDTEDIRNLYNVMSTDGDFDYYENEYFKILDKGWIDFFEGDYKKYGYVDPDIFDYLDARGEGLIKESRITYEDFVNDFGEAKGFVYIPEGGLTGIGLGIYSISTNYPKSSYEALYYGGFVNGVRTGHGRLLVVENAIPMKAVVLFEGEWINDAPNGLGSYVVKQDLGEQSYLSSEVSGMLVNGLWNGTVSVKYENDAKYLYNKWRGDAPSCSFEFTAVNGIITDDKTEELKNRCKYGWNGYSSSTVDVINIEDVEEEGYICYYYRDDLLYDDGMKGMLYVWCKQNSTHGIIGFADNWGLGGNHFGNVPASSNVIFTY